MSFKSAIISFALSVAFFITIILAACSLVMLTIHSDRLMTLNNALKHINNCLGLSRESDQAALFECFSAAEEVIPNE